MALNVRDSYEEVLGVFPSEVCPVCVRCNQALRSPEWRSQERICLASDWLGVLRLSEAEKGRSFPKPEPLVTSPIGLWKSKLRVRRHGRHHF